jgi:hypothetical protein
VDISSKENSIGSGICLWSQVRHDMCRFQNVLNFAARNCALAILRF